ncbi:hypothetical protein LXL04_036347 [Taraxacum kok-saghyz]
MNQFEIDEALRDTNEHGYMDIGSTLDYVGCETMELHGGDSKGSDRGKTILNDETPMPKHRRSSAEGVVDLAVDGAAEVVMVLQSERS